MVEIPGIIICMHVCTQGLEAELQEKDIRLREELNAKDAEISRLGEELSKSHASPEGEAAKVYT